MPLVRVHEASDGRLFKEYDEYVAHEEGLMFESNWANAFPPGSLGSIDGENAAFLKEFVARHGDKIAALVDASKVKRKGSGKKK